MLFLKLIPLYIEANSHSFLLNIDSEIVDIESTFVSILVIESSFFSLFLISLKISIVWNSLNGLPLSFISSKLEAL